ncbi:hypothetical protein [Salegentibacter sp. Hel_I_6]|jgi:hypothetical protein|uniref:hypothetical protein n=1 Tax=Salegentibacter sp. Hel_I_6 TaxID=1250278 RepID=UPI00055B7F1B|nr:hypothetical protein [Salegentibacter sp. Hel_I_6]|tara:strand:- start:171 stop:530 length:360 start_codon:yes stop_codon:yes gene_type:complete
MSTKALISLFLIPLFLGKLLIVDASLINLLSKGTISFVNPYCEKKALSSDKEKTYEFVQNVENQNLMVEISSFCTPQFNFNIFSWTPRLSEVFFEKNTIYSSKLSYLYLDSHSPPPKLV